MTKTGVHYVQKGNPILHMKTKLFFFFLFFPGEPFKAKGNITWPPKPKKNKIIWGQNKRYFVSRQRIIFLFCFKEFMPYIAVGFNNS